MRTFAIELLSLNLLCIHLTPGLHTILFGHMQDAAPFTGVFKPAEPLALLHAGNGTEAGAGGSRGVWTLAVTDTHKGNLDQ